MTHSPNEAISLADKDTYYLVKFKWTDSAAKTQTWTDWGQDVIHSDGLTYLSETSMQIKLPPNDGTLKAAPCTITMPLPDPADPSDLRERIAETKHQAVEVEIVEVVIGVTGGENARIATVYRGRLSRVRKNASGHNGQIRLDFQSPKSQLAIGSGLQCNHQCVNRLGDALCKVNLASYTDTGTLTSISGGEVTITGLGSQLVRYYDKGYVSFEGLNISIRDWSDPDVTKFQLVRQPPAHWLNKTVSVTAGCDKSIDTCRNRFAPPGGPPAGTTGNEGNFNGIGIAIPAYNPVFETGR